MKSLLLLVILHVFFYPINVRAQKAIADFDPTTAYKNGIDLYSKEKYGSALEHFKQITEAGNLHPPISKNLLIDACYYSAICAMNLYHSDAEKQLVSFIKTHPTHPKARTASFQLANLYYRQSMYAEAIERYEDVDIFTLSTDETAELYFKLGYSYFKKFKYEKAQEFFHEITDITSKYSNSANYYYGYIAYTNKNYPVALKSFLKLTDSEAYGKIMPSYIIQIYYLQGKYDELISYAEKLLDTKLYKNTGKINVLVAQAYYHKGNFKKSAEYLQGYMDVGINLTPDIMYQYAFALYKNQEWSNATIIFQKLCAQGDSLSQNALFHLGDCYLQLGEKRKARAAFDDAAKLSFDKSIQETSFFNFAKLSYELAYHKEAVNLLQGFIKKYPKSSKSDEAKELLSDVFLSTKNYQEALLVLGSIKHRTPKIDKAHQKVAYYRGIEYYNKRHFDNALTLFDVSLKYPVDVVYHALSHYWKAETYYKLNMIDSAMESYLDYSTIPVAGQNDFNLIAKYNIGYCYFKKELYSKALTYFNDYITMADTAMDLKDPKIQTDAAMRTADCNFILKDYKNAVAYYDKNIQNNAPNTDYALFQKAIISGIQDSMELKINTMSSIVDNHKESPYVDDALFEIANSYFLLKNYDQALSYLGSLQNNYPQSSYFKNSLLSMGLIHFNLGEDDKALSAYKSVVAKYPSTDEAREALRGIKNIFVSQDKVDDYVAFVNTVPSYSITLPEQDSMAYEAAELRFMKGDCQSALLDFTRYLEKFPDGYFAINVHFYKAECETKFNKLQDALLDYTYVLNQPRNKFTEKSLQSAADISFQFQLYGDAIAHYLKLEEIAEYKNSIVSARVGLMKSYFLQKEYSLSMLYANKILMYEKSTADAMLESHLYLGKSALALDSLDIAFKEFEITKYTTSDIGSEAHYNMAFIYFKKSDFTAAESTVFDLVSRIPPNDYWIAKGYILLSNIYVQQQDYFQAKHTLQSIIDNYEGKDEIKETAAKKLEEVKNIELAKQQVGIKDSTEEQLEIVIPEEEVKPIE